MQNIYQEKIFEDLEEFPRPTDSTEPQNWEREREEESIIKVPSDGAEVTSPINGKVQGRVDPSTTR